MTPHTIYKYDLEEGQNLISMPKGAIILHVESVNDVPRMWVQVQAGGAIENRRIAMVMTGHNLDPEELQGKYIGTAVCLNGREVWHVFDLGVE